MAKVKLEKVYKVYEGGVRAVNDFNLDIPDKEFVVFVGPSGCGKSTTLRMIAGLEDITQGKLYIDDEVVNDVESKNRDIAMVFQNYALYPHMTVYQNMAFGLKLRHTPKQEIDERVKKAAEILEISELLSRKPKALSGGQRQRVALGRAIVREPKVFLLDEPLSNLDAKLRVQMRSEITKLHEKLKTTFIYVTHDQTEAMTMGSRIVVMKDGFIQQVDSPVALYEEPANLFVATFLGSPQMNIIDATLSIDNKKLFALLDESSDKIMLEFSDLKRKELINDSYIGKKVLFGIRPESIRVCDDGDISAIVDVVEQLGDETILHCEIAGLNKNIVVKAPFLGRIKAKQEIKLRFDMEQAHLFDKESTNSILGMRSRNDFKVNLKEDGLSIGKNTVPLFESLKKTIIPSAFGKDLILSTEVNSIFFEEKEDAIKLPIKIEFKEQKTDYVAVYFKVAGLDEYFVLKQKNDSTEDPQCIYISKDNIYLYDKDGELVNSREVIFSNRLHAHIKEANGELVAQTNAGAFKILDSEENRQHLNQEVEIEIDVEGPQVIFNKALNKENPEHNNNIEKTNIIKFEAYDEYKSKQKNFIYGLVRGFENYVTFLVPNDFSVYKMDKFQVCIPKESIKIIC